MRSRASCAGNRRPGGCWARRVIGSLGGRGPARWRDGQRWRGGLWPGLRRAVPGPVPAQEEAAEFVGSPNDEGERGDGGELGAGEGGGAEDAVQGGCVDQRGGEG